MSTRCLLQTGAIPGEALDKHRVLGVTDVDAQVCYNAAITACGKSSHWRLALGLLRQMESGKLDAWPDIISYNAAIDACAKSGRSVWIRYASPRCHREENGSMIEEFLKGFPSGRSGVVCVSSPCRGRECFDRMLAARHTAIVLRWMRGGLRDTSFGGEISAVDQLTVIG